MAKNGAKLNPTPREYGTMWIPPKDEGPRFWWERKPKGTVLTPERRSLLDRLLGRAKPIRLAVSPGAALVARKGIVIGSNHRSERMPEAARIQARDTVRAALGPTRLIPAHAERSRGGAVEFKTGGLVPGPRVANVLVRLEAGELVLSFSRARSLFRALTALTALGDLRTRYFLGP